MSQNVGSSTESTGGESTQEHLQDLFLEVTGTEVCVETQEQHSEQSREVVGEDGSTAEYVSTMVQDDGLSETLAEPSSESQPE